VGIEATTLDGGYIKASGTSFSAPQITGATARVWSVCRQCSNADVKRCLLSSASTAPTRSDELGFGLLNAADTDSCLINTLGCCAEPETPNVLNAPTQALIIVQNSRPASPAQAPAQAPASVPDLDKNQDEPMCPLRKSDQRCRWDTSCCSGRCVGSGWTAKSA
jgi:hypothetical protein